MKTDTYKEYRTQILSQRQIESPADEDLDNLINDLAHTQKHPGLDKSVVAEQRRKADSNVLITRHDDAYIAIIGPAPIAIAPPCNASVIEPASTSKFAAKSSVVSSPTISSAPVTPTALLIGLERLATELQVKAGVDSALRLQSHERTGISSPLALLVSSQAPTSSSSNPTIFAANKSKRDFVNNARTGEGPIIFIEEIEAESTLPAPFLFVLQVAQPSGLKSFPRLWQKEESVKATLDNLKAVDKENLPMIE